jgi:hypothetical protein
MSTIPRIRHTESDLEIKRVQIHLIRNRVRLFIQEVFDRWRVMNKQLQHSRAEHCCQYDPKDNGEAQAHIRACLPATLDVEGGRGRGKDIAPIDAIWPLIRLSHYYLFYFIF